MRLNATIIKDWLGEGFSVQSRIQRPYKFPLKRAAVYKDRMELNHSTLYICQPHQAAEISNVSTGMTFACAGRIDESELGRTAEYICAPEGYDPLDLMNAVVDAFAFYDEWDRKLATAYGDQVSFHEFGMVGYEVFQNDLCLLDAQNFLLFHAYDPKKGYNPEYFPFEEGTYFSKESIDAISQNPAYQDALKEKHPTLFTEANLPFDTLQYNLFDGNQRIAQLTVDLINRPCRPSDYSLLYHVGGYAKRMLANRTMPYHGFNEAFNSIMKGMLERREPYTMDSDRKLESIGWRRNDSFRCFVMMPAGKAEDAAPFQQCALNFTNLFPGSCVYKVSDSNIMVCVVQSRDSSADLDRSTLKVFLDRSGLACGAGESFKGFKGLMEQYSKAKIAVETGLARNPELLVYRFEDYVLDYMVKTLLDAAPIVTYRTESLKRLKSYDQEASGELEDTLECYLRNDCSAKKTVEELNIYRTTLYYRLEKIEEVCSFSLKDHQTRIYLSLYYLLNEAEE